MDKQNIIEALKSLENLKRWKSKNERQKGFYNSADYLTSKADGIKDAIQMIKDLDGVNEALNRLTRLDNIKQATKENGGGTFDMYLNPIAFENGYQVGLEGRGNRRRYVNNQF